MPWGKILAFESLHSSPVPTAPASDTEGQWASQPSPTDLMLSRNDTDCFPLPLVFIVLKNTFSYDLKHVHMLPVSSESFAGDLP